MSLFSRVLLVFAPALCLVALSNAASAEVQTRGAGAVHKATLVFAIGGLGDGSFNDQTWAGLQQAGIDFGVSVNYLEPGAPENRDQTLINAANSDSDLIIATGTMFSDLITQLAETHTTQSFVCIDYSHSGTIPANLAGLDFREHEGAFLVGMIAALKSNTQHVGFVGAMPIPLIQKFEAGYAQGAKHAVSGVRVDALYASATDSGFDDPAKGKQLANSLIDSGADVIFHASGSTGLGVFEAAEQRGVMAIGVDKDQSSQAAPGVIITSMLKKEDQLIYQVVQKAVAGQFPAGHHSYGLAEGVIDYVYNSSLISTGIHDQVEAAKANIISGAIVVSPTPAPHAAAQDWTLFD